MQEAEEQDTCRICSTPAEEGHPLFYPCKCSGTIRYIHQECLTTWLAHSKKKTCDVCKYPYSFTKVYSPDMPATLPPLLFLRRLAQQSFFLFLFALRAAIIAVLWLAILPWLTIWTWRVYFTFGASAAWWINGTPFTDSTLVANINNTYTNETITSQHQPLHVQMRTRPFWTTLSNDIFAGQIIAALIVLVFVAVFLLREWISQNARPGMFEDDEDIVDLPIQGHVDLELMPIEDQRREMPWVQPIPPEQLEGENRDVNEFVRRVRVNLPDPRPAELGEDADHRNDGPVLDRQPILIRTDSSTYVDTGNSHQASGESSNASSSKGKRKVPDDEANDIQLSPRELSNETDIPTSVSTALPDYENRPFVYRRPRPAVDADYQGEGTSAAGSGKGGDNGRAARFDFSFRSPNPPPQHSAAIDVVSARLPPESEDGHSGILSDNPLARSLSSSYELLSASTLDSPPDPSASVAERSTPTSSMSSITDSNASPLRRPTLPSTTFPFPPTEGDKPLVSPSLATYRAPEDLEPGTEPSSGPTNYFERDTDDHEFRHYFRETSQTNGPSSKTDPEHMDLPPPESEEEDEEDEEEGEEGEGDITDDDTDWELELEQQQQQQQQQQPQQDHNIRDVNPNQAQQPIAAQFGDAFDEMEGGGVEDDMDGAMEAIGLRGPIFGVVQNAILMVFVLDTAIGFGVGLPFLIGKSTALLSLNPQRSLYILHLPIRAMRYLTDPIVDLTTFILFKTLLPHLFRMSRVILNLLFHPVQALTGGTMGKIAIKEAEFNAQVSQCLERATHIWNVIVESQWPTPSAQSSATRDKIFESDWHIVRMAEPRFASLGFQVRTAAERLQLTWIKLALENGTREKVFAVGLGYAVVGLILALYLNVFTVGNARTAGRAVRSAIRQQLLVLKVATFIIVELVIFPLGCGTLLDACTIWLFPETSLESRTAFFAQAPLTALFYHWVAGTMFMYQFAILLASCRTIMRPGAMWFIKDPQDQNFHPIRDILERPTITQIRKLCMSALMYSVVVGCGVGSVAALLFVGNKSIFPLRWRTREPLSDVPIDLLFLLFALPYTLHYFRPKKVFHQTAIRTWRFLAKQFRLTSYMFGERCPEEEYTVRYKSWSAYFLRFRASEGDTEKVSDGSFRRVPAKDNIALPRDMRATAPVLENGEPVDEAARLLITSQNEEAEKAKRDIKADYTIVYIPCHCRPRIFSFIFTLWVVIAISISVGVALPIQVGRRFFKLFVAKDVHDGYSFIAGFYLLWGCYIVSKTVHRMDKRRQRRSKGGPRARFSVFFVKRVLLWFAKISYMVLFLGVIIPTLLALVIELYITLPIRLTLDPAMVPHLRIFDLWALGLVYGTIGLRVHRVHPHQVTQGLTNIIHRGWSRPDPIIATREVIAPLSGGFLGMILVPAAAVWAGRYFLALPIDNKFTLLHVYPGIFALAGLARSLVASANLVSSWSQQIRDKEFLVEMRLRNLESDEKTSQEENSATSSK